MLLYVIIAAHRLIVVFLIFLLFKVFLRKATVFRIKSLNTIGCMVYGQNFFCECKQNMLYDTIFLKVREPGVEPGSIAWKATMLPLYHSRL